MERTEKMVWNLIRTNIPQQRTYLCREIANAFKRNGSSSNKSNVFSRRAGKRQMHLTLHRSSGQLNLSFKYCLFDGKPAPVASLIPYIIISLLWPFLIFFFSFYLILFFNKNVENKASLGSLSTIMLKEVGADVFFNNVVQKRSVLALEKVNIIL